MARLYLKRTLSGFAAADEPSADIARKFKVGEIYRADIVKPRSYQHHKLCMALLTLTYQNQERYTSFDMFRKAVALEAGHVNEIIKLDGEVVLEPGSLSYDALDEVEFARGLRHQRIALVDLRGDGLGLDPFQFLGRNAFVLDAFEFATQCRLQFGDGLAFRRLAVEDEGRLATQGAIVAGASGLGDAAATH